jgi:hypothetical protein
MDCFRLPGAALGSPSPCTCVLHLTQLLFDCGRLRIDASVCVIVRHGAITACAKLVNTGCRAGLISGSAFVARAARAPASAMRAGDSASWA